MIISKQMIILKLEYLLEIIKPWANYLDQEQLFEAIIFMNDNPYLLKTW